MSEESGVLLVAGFCDDWSVALRGIRAVRLARRLVTAFEGASGLVVHQTKSKFIPNRIMTSAERRALLSAWPRAVTTQQQVTLGTALGHGVQVSQFIRGGGVKLAPAPAYPGKAPLRRAHESPKPSLIVLARRRSRSRS